MATMKLLVVPDGRAILTTSEPLSDQARFELSEAIAGWRDGTWPVLVIPDCDVVQVAAIDIDIDGKAPA